MRGGFIPALNHVRGATGTARTANRCETAVRIRPYALLFYPVMTERDYIDMDIADAVMERPQGFRVGEKRFSLYPVTLGKLYLLKRLTDTLGIDIHNVSLNPYLEAIRLCAEKRDTVCELIAYHTFNRKRDLFDTEKIRHRAGFFNKSLDNEELAQLLVTALSGYDLNAFLKHLGIDRERADYQKALKAKKDNGGSFSFFGRSVYGTLIDCACSRYGWTFGYVVWGISYINLQMLMSDTIATVYLNEQERKNARLPRNRDFIDGDDPKNMARIKSLFSD